MRVISYVLAGPHRRTGTPARLPRWGPRPSMPRTLRRSAGATSRVLAWPQALDTGRLLDHEPRAGAADHAGGHTERQRHRRSSRMARRESNQDGPRKILEQIGHDGAAGEVAFRLVAVRQLADDDGRGAREHPRLTKLQHLAVESIRALPHFVEKQDVSTRRRKGERRADRGEHLRQRATEQQTFGLAGPDRLESWRRQLAHRLGPRQGA